MMRERFHRDGGSVFLFLASAGCKLNNIPTFAV